MTQPLALISVTNKTNLEVLGKGLMNSNYKILSTGGTAKYLVDHGIEVTDISEWTGLESIMDGRVKTLHPKIYAGILCDQANPKHIADMQQINSEHIKLVCVNLYDFASQGVGLEMQKAIEYIDIGGPTLLRASAKNYKSCLSVIDPNDYSKVLAYIQDPSSNQTLPETLAAKVFASISAYDGMIASYFNSTQNKGGQAELQQSKSLDVQKVLDLRYGENPHQQAAFYKNPQDFKNGSLSDIEVLQGKPLSYNNLLDLNSAIELVRDLSPYQACAIIKHNNPCGVACSRDPSHLQRKRLDSQDDKLYRHPERNEGSLKLFKKALACDPTSAFGGIIALNQTVTAGLATFITENMFIECLVAPEFDEEAQKVFAQKKNVRLLKSNLPLSKANPSHVWTQVRGGFLIQESDSKQVPTKDWRCTTKQQPTAQQLADLEIANIIAKHVKSNALVFVKDMATVAIGAGQMSRIDAARIALFKNRQCREEDKMQLALQGLEGSAMASDAFFPFSDVVQTVAKEGVKAVVQPGGSIRDDDSTKACDSLGVTMLHTGVRHFRH